MFEKTAHLYDLFYDGKDYSAEVQRLREIVAERHPHARTLLDVACGTGRHLELLASSFEVEGLDIDSGLLDVARGRLSGVALHCADMRDFDLGRTFDVVTCLFSSIGYVQSVENLGSAVKSMARHVAPSGALIVEPWITPANFDPNHIGRAVIAERRDLQAVRMNGARVDGRLSVLDFHYLVARPGTVEHLAEKHTLGLFTDDEYADAFRAVGLAVEHDPLGLMGRGLWIGRRP